MAGHGRRRGDFRPLIGHDKVAKAIRPNGWTIGAAFRRAHTPFFSGAKPSSQVSEDDILSIHDFGNPCRETLPRSCTLTSSLSAADVLWTGSFLCTSRSSEGLPNLKAGVGGGTN